MEHVNVPSVLSFRYSEIKEFRMYSGSRRGAVELDTSIFDPMNIWKDYIVQKRNLYQDLMLIFIDDTTLTFFPDKYKYKYKLENEILQIYNAHDNEWTNFAYGNRDKLIIKQGLACSGKDSYFDRRRAKNEDETCYSAFNYAGIPSLSYLKDKQSMIAWCNVHYTFQ